MNSPTPAGARHAAPQQASPAPAVGRGEAVVVAAAVDDDTGRAGVVRYAAAEAGLMVVAARGRQAADGEPLGGTVRALVGRTACALAVLPADRDAVRWLPR